MEREEDDLDWLLNRLRDPDKRWPAASLPVLSDLHGERLERFGRAMETLPPARRRRLLRSLVELCEDNFEVDFGAVFRRCLADPDAAVRAAAVEGVWEDEGHDLIGPLLALLRGDPSPGVRAAAAAGLGHFVLAGELEELDAPTEHRIVEELLTTVHLAGEEVEVRGRALESAAYAGSPEVCEALEMAYDQDEPELKLSAVRGMGRACDARWRSILLDELESRSDAMRYEAVVACGEMELADSVPRLGQMLSDPDRQVAEAAIWALGQIGGIAARDLLLDAYNDADEEMEAAIDDALAEQALFAGTSSLDLYDLDDADLEWLMEEDDAGSDTPDEDDASETDRDR